MISSSVSRKSSYPGTLIEGDHSSLIEFCLRSSRREILLASVLVANDASRCHVKSDHPVWLFQSSGTIAPPDSLRRRSDWSQVRFILYRKWLRYFSTPPSIGVVRHHNSRRPLPVCRSSSSPTIVLRPPHVFAVVIPRHRRSLLSWEHPLSSLPYLRYRLFARERASIKVYRSRLTDPINDGENGCWQCVCT